MLRFWAVVLGLLAGTLLFFLCQAAHCHISNNTWPAWNLQFLKTSAYWFFRTGSSAFGQVIRVALPNKLNVATAILIPTIGVIILVSSLQGLALAATTLRLSHRLRPIRRRLHFHLV